MYVIVFRYSGFCLSNCQVNVLVLSAMLTMFISIPMYLIVESKYPVLVSCDSFVLVWVQFKGVLDLELRLRSAPQMNAVSASEILMVQNMEQHSNYSCPLMFFFLMVICQTFHLLSYLSTIWMVLVSNYQKLMKAQLVVLS